MAFYSPPIDMNCSELAQQFRGDYLFACSTQAWEREGVGGGGQVDANSHFLFMIIAGEFGRGDIVSDLHLKFRMVFP